MCSLVLQGAREQERDKIQVVIQAWVAHQCCQECVFLILFHLKVYEIARLVTDFTESQWASAAIMKLCCKGSRRSWPLLSATSVLEFLHQSPLYTFFHTVRHIRGKLSSLNTHVHQNNPKSRPGRSSVMFSISSPSELIPLLSWHPQPGGIFLLVEGNIGAEMGASLVQSLQRSCSRGGSALVFPICATLSSYLCQAALSFLVWSSAMVQTHLWVFRVMQQVLLGLCFTVLCKKDGCHIHLLRSAFNPLPILWSSSVIPHHLHLCLSVVSHHAAANKCSKEIQAFKFHCKTQLTLTKATFYQSDTAVFVLQQTGNGKW